MILRAISLLLQALRKGCYISNWCEYASVDTFISGLAGKERKTNLPNLLGSKNDNKKFNTLVINGVILYIVLVL